MAFSSFGSALKLQAEEAERCSYPLRVYQKVRKKLDSSNSRFLEYGGIC